jgi:hypothetical protein
VARFDLPETASLVYEDFVRLLSGLDRDVMRELCDEALRDADESRLLAFYDGTAPASRSPRSEAGDADDDRRLV